MSTAFVTSVIQVKLFTKLRDLFKFLTRESTDVGLLDLNSCHQVCPWLSISASLEGLAESERYHFKGHRLRSFFERFGVRLHLY